MKTYKDYFNFSFWRIGFVFNSEWTIIIMNDKTVWKRIGLGFYWRKL